MTWFPWRWSAWLGSWAASIRGLSKRTARIAAGRILAMGEGIDLGEATCIRETPAAIIVKMTNGSPFEGTEAIPQSQVHDDSEVWKEGQTGKLVITAWLARKRGWDEEGPKELDGELRWKKRSRWK